MKIKNQILIVDDDPFSQQALAQVLKPYYEVHTFSEPTSARHLLKNAFVGAVILDLHLGKVEGYEVLRSWKKEFPELPIIVCSGQTDVRLAMDCLKEGASEYLVKPSDSDDVLFAVRRTLEKQLLKKQGEPLLKPGPVEFIGNSLVVQELKEKIHLLKNQTHLNVLILGESGTGKEILARVLHQQEESTRRPFVVANMPAIPANLVEAELFGVEKGAYTDAKTARAGKFELAENGDIFLDEIGDLPFEVQAKLLRTLQEKQVQRVGSNQNRNLNFRTIAATNRPLSTLMASGEFREDLVYRLSDMVLWIPPLRERMEDLPLLVQHFLEKHSRGKLLAVSEKVFAHLKTYSWPGNIRQLESTIKRAIIFAKDGVIEKVEIFDLGQLKSAPELATDKDFATLIAASEKSILESTLKQTQGNRQLAMEHLKLSKATFYRKLQELGIT